MLAALIFIRSIGETRISFVRFGAGRVSYRKKSPPRQSRISAAVVDHLRHRMCIAAFEIMLLCEGTRSTSSSTTMSSPFGYLLSGRVDGLAR